MDLKDSLTGGVLVSHKIQEGKHHYEVENVMEYKKASGKAFVRRGDKLMQINGTDLQDVTPEELAQSIALNNPMLTVHRASKIKVHTELSFPAEDILHPVSKKSMTLSFRMEMRRLEDLGKEARQEGEGKEACGIEEDVSQDGNEVDGKRRDMLIISMKHTRISLMRGRGCDSCSPCKGCHGTGCIFNDVVMVAESSEVVLVSRGGGSFRPIKSLDTPVQHVVSHNYLRSFCQEKRIYALPNPEEMTIYYYKSSGSPIIDGQPVVLKFSKSNCFLRCCKEGEKVCLQVETCERERLRTISRSDESTLSFVFYMKSSVTRERTFESALHGGWFIQVDTNSVNMDTKVGGRGEEAFLFIIQT